MLCLAEWCMSVPRDFLRSPPPGCGTSDSLLHTVLRALHAIVADKEPESVAETPVTPVESVDMDFTIFSDAADRGAGVSANRKPFIDARAADDPNVNTVIKTAAKMCLGYLYNHLGTALAADDYRRQFIAIILLCIVPQATSRGRTWERRGSTLTLMKTTTICK